MAFLSTEKKDCSKEELSMIVVWIVINQFSECVHRKMDSKGDHIAYSLFLY